MVVHPYSGILFSKTEKNEALYVCRTTAECLTQQKCIFSWGFPDGLDSKESTAMQETWVQSWGWEDPLEKEMATHSSMLAWEIPWIEESGGLQSTGS